jgi:hypothetical protein
VATGPLDGDHVPPATASDSVEVYPTLIKVAPNIAEGDSDTVATIVA